MTRAASGRTRALGIAALYALFGAGWILYSDAALAALVADPQIVVRLSVYKGVGYVVVTALLLYLLVRRAFQALDRSTAEARGTARLLTGQNVLLSQIAHGAPLGETLERLVDFLERRMPGTRCSVLLLEDDGLHVRHGAMPRLPKAYAEAIDGSPIGPKAGSCGTAMFRKESVYVEDIAIDPLWDDYRALALSHGLRACWSTPLLDTDRRCLGSFAVYKDVPGLPTVEEQRLMAVAAQLGSVALSRERAIRDLRESEGRFTAFMDASPAIAWVTDALGQHVYMNHEWERAFQRPREQWMGRTADDLVGPEAGARIRAHDQEVLAGNAPVEIDEESFELDGRRLVWHLHKFPFQNTAGERFVGGFAIDVTPRARAVEALREVEGRLSTVVANLREGLIVSDRDGQFVHWNPAALRMIGEEQHIAAAAQDGATYQGFYDNFSLHTLDGTPIPRADWPLARVRRGEQLLEHEVEVRRRGSDWRRIFSYSGALAQYGGGHELAFLTLADITQRKEDERLLRASRDHLERTVEARTAELREALERAESADRLKSAFLATMSHELRTPLNSIIGFTGILLQGLPGPLNGEQQKQLGMVRGSARHLLALINDVLDLSKIEAGQLELAAQPFALEESVERCVAIIRPLAEQKQLTLTVDCGEPGLEMHTDQRRVEQVVLNLLNNAVKFTTRGGVTLRVRSAEHDGRPAVRLEVVDTGIGIQDRDLRELFQPFRQIDTGLTRQHEGTGLGLSICRRLTTLLGGSISAESKFGEGSRFSVTLPRRLGAR